MKRRAFLSGLAALGANSALAPALIAGARAKVVVIGGGAGGATIARYLAKESRDQLDVTLVEPKRHYTACFHSNLYLGDLRNFSSLVHGYERLRRQGVSVIHQAASQIDRDRRLVELKDGVRLSYDRLVLAPGIDLNYDSLPGWGKRHQDRMPHAWQGGEQSRILKSRLEAVPDGGLVVILAPPNPYRCPPGPYERASLIAHRLAVSGRRRAKIVILDAKESFSKQKLFQDAWDRHYPGMIEWAAASVHDGVKSIDPASGTVMTGFETFRNAALVNVIPPQMAGGIAKRAGLADQTGYCPVQPEGMQSRRDSFIHVIGDAANAGDMPKSAFSANNQAKVVAGAIQEALLGVSILPSRYFNTCWSVVAPDDAIKIGGRYQPQGESIRTRDMFISKLDESRDQRRKVFAQNLSWYEAIAADIFGS